MGKERKQPFRSTDFASLVRVVRSASPRERVETVEERRRLLAELCQLLGRRLTGAEVTRERVDVSSFPPRARQVLELLLKGRSEKEVAAELDMSVHTVHVHVKGLYKRLGVSSRGELMAKCLRA